MQKKSFTVGYLPQSKSENTPYIRISGNWLKEFGIDVGDKLELVKGKNMLVLTKVPSRITEQERKNKEILKLESQIRFLQHA